MVRTLPWLKQPAQQKSQTASGAAAAVPDAKRRRVDSKSPPPSSNSRSASIASSTTSSKPRDAAAIATTAAKTAKPAVSADNEYMRAGLAQDDRYIMVEDQLLAVARSLTSTLHSAEYARRKALAAAHAPAFPNSIARPTVSSAIPGERRMANRATAHKRQLILANSENNNKNMKLDTSNISSDEDEEEAVKAMLKAEGDNASGTVFAKGALGRLMRTKPTKVERKLDVKTGSSRTRAAAGFKKANASTPTSQRTNTQIERDEVPSSPLRRKNTRSDVYQNESEDDPEDDLDDAGEYDVAEYMNDDSDETDGSEGLDVPAPRRQAPKKQPSPPRRKKAAPSITKSTRHSHRSTSPRVFGEDEGTGSDDLDVIPAAPHTKLQERFEAEESDDMEILPAPSRTKKALSPRRRPTPPRSKSHHTSSSSSFLTATTPSNSRNNNNNNNNNNNSNHSHRPHTKPQTPVKSILKKKPVVIELSSDSEDMDEAEAERWRRRRKQQQQQQQQQNQDPIKATKEIKGQDEKDRKRNSSSTAPMGFLGLKYST